MNYLKLIIVPSLTFSLFGCGVLPIDLGIKEDHFRIENFRTNLESEKEYVYLMCSNKKPAVWTQPKQYLAGEHDLWVKVATMRRSIENSTREAVVNFKVNLEADKSYMLNRKIEADTASVWIQEADTGLIVSDVKTAELTYPLGRDYHKEMHKCRAGTV